MIERMRVRNFRRYRDATLNFKAGVNFIEGQNNAGKTSLFYAIEYAFFGRVEGFKSVRGLASPGKRSLGVELVFQGRTGERYLLQRVHQMPPRSRKTMEGHFTLKAISDDGERYLLASDFGDTEDRLALKLRELTGLTRRLFSVAIHMRQGDIAAILDGAKQLDIVLGVTAAAMAEDELRQVALDLEKESAGLAVLEERLRSVGGELSGVAGELAALAVERQATAGKLAALGEAADPRAEVERRLAPLFDLIAAYEECQQQGELARQRLDDEQERWAAATRNDAHLDVEREVSFLEEEKAKRHRRTEQMRADLNQMDTDRRQLDQQRGDLAGRVERRRSLPAGEGATCEACGAPIDAAHVAEELARWSAELDRLDRSLAELQERQSGHESALERADAEDRKDIERLTQLTEQQKQFAELVSILERRRGEWEEAAAAEEAAFAAVQAEARSLVSVLEEASCPARWDTEGEPDAVLASIHDAIQALRQSLAERVGRQVAQKQALAELLERFDGQKETLERRQADLEREQATTQAEAGAQQINAARAVRLRKMSAGFKELQAQIRGEAAGKLAADTLGLHRQLSERDEFESLTIDPTHYAVQVVPRDLGEEVPAGLYEGGGHRLLLGLAFRLSVARLVDFCPFLMLDEPTYGLDVAHREALLNRIAGQDVSKQILLVTHQAMGDVPGHRIRVVRQERETVVADTAGG